MYDRVPGDLISGQIAFNGCFELGLSEEISKLSQDGQLFVDAGANMGYFSLLWVALNPNGRCIAFEVDPRNIKLFAQNIAENGLASRIKLVGKAAGRTTGRVHFQFGPAQQTGWGGISNEVSTNTIEVPVVRLDEELSDCMIDTLKIDVEGADTWVLYGCEALLRNRQIRRIFFE